MADEIVCIILASVRLYGGYHMNGKHFVYRLTNELLIRCPTLPVEFYERLCEEYVDNSLPILAHLENEEWLSLALSLSSPNLVNSLHTISDATVSSKQEISLLSYFVRMSTRPTPFGLFAAVGPGYWGQQTTMKIEEIPAKVAVRLDMDWLLRLIKWLENNPHIASRLTYIKNPAVYIKGGYAFLLESYALESREKRVNTALLLTPITKNILTLSTERISFDELHQNVINAVSANFMIDHLIELVNLLRNESFLFSNLRPPFLMTNPVEYLVEQLNTISDIKEVNDVIQTLSKISSKLADMHQSAFRFSRESYEGLLDTIKQLPIKSDEVPIQVDSYMTITNPYINLKVGEDIEKAVEWLLHLNPDPGRSARIAEYFQRFQNEYGLEREVPLLELLDKDFGLGFPLGYWSNDDEALSRYQSHNDRRNRLLIDLASQAILDHKTVVELDDTMIDALATPLDIGDLFAETLEAIVRISASSSTAVDEGHYQIGIQLISSPAGRLTGRFLSLLPQDWRRGYLQSITEKEDPDILTAEVVSLPKLLRLANVLLHEPIVEAEIPLGVAGVAPTIVPLNELVVGTAHGRFYLRWLQANRLIKVTSFSAVVYRLMPAVARFLLELSLDSVIRPSTFDWGNAKQLPFLPRLQKDRVIISPAQWNIHRQTQLMNYVKSNAFFDKFQFWSKTWKVPRYVLFTSSWTQSEPMLLDLQNNRQLQILQKELGKLSEDDTAQLVESTTAPHNIWLEGPKGRHEVEVVATLKRDRSDSKNHYKVNSQLRTVEKPLSPVDESQRLRPPGSDWLYAKLYCRESIQTKILTTIIKPFIEQNMGVTTNGEWYFVRYIDPKPHLRLRFHSNDPKILSSIGQALSSLAHQLVKQDICQRLCFDTYEREIERYGGQYGLNLAEKLFHIDSEITLSMLNLLNKGTEFDQIMISALSVDNLLSCLGLDLAERNSWYQQNFSYAKTSDIYRKRKQELRILFCEKTALAHKRGGEELIHIFTECNKRMNPIRHNLQELSSRGALDKPLAKLYSSYVHMHCNRLMGTDLQLERTVMELVSRTIQGLVLS